MPELWLRRLRLAAAEVVSDVPGGGLAAGWIAAVQAVVGVSEADALRARRLNESLRIENGHDSIPIAFFCECGDPSCFQPVWLTGLQYGQARRKPTWAPLSPGHLPACDASSGEDEQATEQETEATRFEPLDLLPCYDDSLHEILRGVPLS